MPSAHSASVCALATAVGLEAGFGSALFGAVAFFSVLVLYDAAGIRQAASRQARVLNRMLDDLKAHHSIQGERLIELLSDENLRDRLRTRGREVAEQFRVGHVVDRLERFFVSRRS